MKKICFSIFLLIIPSICFAWGEMGKVDNLIKAGKHNPSRLNQAIEILESIVEKEPDNHKAYFKLGEIYAIQGRYSQADREFKTANEFHDYRKQIAPVFKTKYEEALRKGEDVNQLYQITSYWDSSFRENESLRLFNNGEQALANGQIGTASRYFKFLVSVDPEYKDKVSDIYFNKGDYQTAAEYSSKHNSEIFQVYMKKAEQSQAEQEKQKWRNMASKYGNVPPDFKLYEPGDSCGFPLKKGQTTEHYIRIGKETSYKVYSGVNEDQYELIFRNDNRVKIWAGEKFPANIQDFKIYAKEDVIVEIDIKPYSK